MVHIITNARKYRRAMDQAGQEVEKAQKFAEEYKKPPEFDYETPVRNDEYIGMLKEQQKATKDPHLAREIGKEIRFKKETGRPSGLKN